MSALHPVSDMTLWCVKQRELVVIFAEFEVIGFNQ